MILTIVRSVKKLEDIIIIKDNHEGQANLKDTVKGIETRLNTLIAVAFSAFIAKIIFLK